MSDDFNRAVFNRAAFDRVKTFLNRLPIETQPIRV
jgi:hypothetical protein